MLNCQNCISKTVVDITFTMQKEIVDYSQILSINLHAIKGLQTAKERRDIASYAYTANPLLNCFAQFVVVGKSLF